MPLYPAPLRDLLMRLALTDLFKARWTDAICRLQHGIGVPSSKHPMGVNPFTYRLTHQ